MTAAIVELLFVRRLRQHPPSLRPSCPYVKQTIRRPGPTQRGLQHRHRGP